MIQPKGVALLYAMMDGQKKNLCLFLPPGRDKLSGKAAVAGLESTHQDTQKQVTIYNFSLFFMDLKKKRNKKDRCVGCSEVPCGLFLTYTAKLLSPTGHSDNSVIGE